MNVPLSEYQPFRPMLGRLVVEPREEGQLLKVVCEAADLVGKDGAGQRVADLKVGLATGHLADVAPGWGRVVAEGSFCHSATSWDSAETSDDP